jgi:hypothetical protein
VGRVSVNYTGSKAMGPTNIHSDYNLLNIGRKHIINANSGVCTNNVFRNRRFAAAGNG